MFAGLANQKNHMAIYLCSLYCIPGLREKFTRECQNTGKKLNMGASCIRFRKVEDLPLDVIGSVVAQVDLPSFVATAKRVHSKNKR